MTYIAYFFASFSLGYVIAYGITSYKRFTEVI